MSLRVKLMLALLATGLAAVALVGGWSYVSVDNKVDMLRREHAAEHFQRMLGGYLEKYGSWEAGHAVETFDRYQQRLRLAQQRPDDAPAGRAPDRADGPPPDGAQGSWPVPPRGAQQGRPPGPPDGPRPGEDGPGPGRDNPPYRFIAADQDYRVLLGGGAYHPGELLPEQARRNARAVMARGRVAAYISPEGVFTPSREEQQYLNAVREALLAGGAAAAALAVLLGILLSKGLSRQLSQLTAAVRAIQGGSLLQRVPVEGKGEIAVLAAAFNDMSAQLARSHEELKESHHTILAQSEQLRELSVRDALTKLHNRRHFDEHASGLFERAVRGQHPLSLVICDIDHFKKINDRHSHAVGDAVLRQVGEILRGQLRATDLVARYGGEEFVIALPDTDLPQAAALCDKLRAAIAAFPWSELQPGLAVTMSMGLYGDLKAGTAEAMLRKADDQLYRAKESGRNRVCYA